MNYTQEELKSAKRVKAEILKMDITDFRLIYAAEEINKHNEMRQEMEKLKEELKYFQILAENKAAQIDELEKTLLEAKKEIFPSRKTNILNKPNENKD